MSIDSVRFGKSVGFRRSFLVFGTVVPFFLFGCSDMSMMYETSKKLDAAKADIEKYKPAQKLAEEQNFAQRNKQVYLTAKPVEKTRVLPDIMNQPFAIHETFYRFDEVVSKVSSMTGIPTILTPDAIDYISDLSKKYKDIEENNKNNGSSSSSTFLPPPLMGNIGNGENKTQRMPMFDPFSSSNSMEFRADYKGTLAGFLDSFATRYGLSWKYENGKVVVFHIDTRTFVVRASPGSTSNKATVAGTTSENNSSTVESTFDASSLDVWDSINKSVESMISSSGKVIANAALGTISVTDTPEKLDIIEKFIKKQNDILGKQVAVHIKVLSFKSNDKSQYGVDWSLLNSAISSARQYGFSTSFLPTETASGVLTLKKLATGTVVNGKTVNTSDPWQGSQAVIQALSQQGDVNVVTSTTSITLNNQPVTTRIGRSTTYLKEMQMTISNDPAVPSTSSMAPGSINEGFVLSILPHILPDGKIILQYGMSQSQLVSLNEIKSPDNSSMINAPVVDEKNLIQRLVVGNGDTVVISGFDQDTTNGNKSGASRDIPLIGGYSGMQNQREILIIILQPTVIEA